MKLVVPVVAPNVTDPETVTADVFDPCRSNETLTVPVFPDEANPSNFNCVDAVASTPVLSNKLLIEVAISLAVCPAVTATVVEPS